MADLNNLQRLTQELAEEIHYEEYGHVFKLMSLIFDNVESYVVIIDTNCKLLYINPAAIKACKDLVNIDINTGDNCIKMMQSNPELCKDCLAKSCINQKKVLNEVTISPNTNIKYWRTCIPLAYDGISGVIEILEKLNGR